MANLTRFDPFEDIARLDPFRNMDEFWKEFRVVPAWGGGQAAPRIRMDVSETDQAYVVKAEIPGVNKDDIKVAIEGNQVELSAEIREEKDEKTEKTIRSERYYGQQSRIFSLPQEVDDTKAEAKYYDVILELTLPKKPGSARKQLSVQ